MTTVERVPIFQSGVAQLLPGGQMCPVLKSFSRHLKICHDLKTEIKRLNTHDRQHDLQAEVLLSQWKGRSPRGLIRSWGSSRDPFSCTDITLLTVTHRDKSSPQCHIRMTRDWTWIRCMRVRCQRPYPLRHICFHKNRQHGILILLETFISCIYFSWHNSNHKLKKIHEERYHEDPCMQRI